MWSRPALNFFYNILLCSAALFLIKGVASYSGVSQSANSCPKENCDKKYNFIKMNRALSNPNAVVAEIERELIKIEDEEKKHHVKVITQV